MEVVIYSLIYFIAGFLVSHFAYKQGYQRGRTDEGNILRGDMNEYEALYDRWEKK